MQSYPRLIEMRTAHHNNAAGLIAELDKKKIKLDDRRQRLVDARAEFEDAAGRPCPVCLTCV